MAMPARTHRPAVPPRRKASQWLRPTTPARSKPRSRARGKQACHFLLEDSGIIARAFARTFIEGRRVAPTHSIGPFVLSVGPSRAEMGRSRRAMRFDFVRCAHYAQRERVWF